VSREEFKNKMVHGQIVKKAIFSFLIFLFLLVLFQVISQIGETTDSDDDNSLSTNNVRSHYKKTTEINHDYELAKQESLGFFDDMNAARWNLHKQKVRKMSPNYERSSIRKISNAGTFYQQHYEPDFNCENEFRIGKLGDGGKWICDPHRIAAQEKCLVYSIGSNNDFSFEKSVKEEIGQHCEIHTFDITDYSASARKANVTFHKFGLGVIDSFDLKSFKTIVKELGHAGRTIDIFKIDCEGCEFKSAQTWYDAGVVLRQIQVELHGSPLPDTNDFFDLMYTNNYVITHKEANIQFPQENIRNPWYAIEYAFLKLAPEFWEGHEREKASPS